MDDKVKRARDAILIQEGASNPIGITRTLHDHMLDMHRNGNADTPTICNDPALRLIVHQLAYIMGVVSTVHDFPPNKMNYAESMDACREAVQALAPATDILTREKQGYNLQDLNDAAEATEKFGDDELERAQREREREISKNAAKKFGIPYVDK